MMLGRSHAESSGGLGSGQALVTVTAALLAGLVVAGVGLVDLERPATGRSRPEVSLPGSLAAVDRAIERRDLSRAVREWRDAYGLALRSGRWDAMAAVGDAALRIDRLAGAPAGRRASFAAQARQAYLSALFRARRDGAPEGLARVAAAFASLGDVEMATRAAAMARPVTR